MVPCWLYLLSTSNSFENGVFVKRQLNHTNTIMCKMSEYLPKSVVNPLRDFHDKLLDNMAAISVSRFSRISMTSNPFLSLFSFV